MSTQNDDFEPTSEELAAMKGINDAPILGVKTPTNPDTSKHLVSVGIVEYDDEGRLTLSVRGKRLLAART